MYGQLYEQLMLALVGFLEKNLPNIHRQWWKELVIPYLNQQEYDSAIEKDLSSIDLKALINVFRANYKKFYERKKFFNWSPFYLSGIIKNIRNEKAHTNLKKIRTSDEVLLDIVSAKIFLSYIDPNLLHKNDIFNEEINDEMIKQFNRYKEAYSGEITAIDKDPKKNEISFTEEIEKFNLNLEQKFNQFFNKEQQSIPEENAPNKYKKEIENIYQAIDQTQILVRTNFNKIISKLESFDDTKLYKKTKDKKIQEDVSQRIDEESIISILEKNTSNFKRVVNFKTAKDLLLGIKEIISEENPDIKEEHHILRPSMLNNFLVNKIVNNDLYSKKTSPDMHNNTHRKGLSYLQDIYEVVGKLK